MPNLSKEMQAIVLLDTRTVQMEKRMDKLEFDIPMYGSEADELSNHVKRKGVQILGGKKSEAYRDSNIRSKVYRDISRSGKAGIWLIRRGRETKVI